MKLLIFSLLSAVVMGILGVRWSINHWYSANKVFEENQYIETYQQLGYELIRLVDVSDINKETLDRWVEQSQGRMQVRSYSKSAFPQHLKKSFEHGEPVFLEAGAHLSLNYYFPQQDAVISFLLPDGMRSTVDARLSWALTFFFYMGVTLSILIWLNPLLRRLTLVRQATRSFGAGDLNARIVPHPISCIVDIEQEFNRMAQQIQVLIDDNKLLSGGLSHDLRTAIARLRFGLDVFEESELLPSQRKKLGHMNRDLEAMESLANALLNYARFDHALINFKPDVLNLCTICADLINDFYDGRVTFNTEDSAKAIIFADKEYLVMLVHNLLQNAERYGCGEISVTIVSNEKIVTLIIEDNGPGIALAERDSVLKPFYRSSDVKATQGHGMGLAIVGRIVQWHGAKLLLDQSEKLGGLKVSVEFEAHVVAAVELNTE